VDYVLFFVFSRHVGCLSCLCYFILVSNWANAPSHFGDMQSLMWLVMYLSDVSVADFYYLFEIYFSYIIAVNYNLFHFMTLIACLEHFLFLVFKICFKN